MKFLKVLSVFSISILAINSTASAQTPEENLKALSSVKKSGENAISNCITCKEGEKSSANVPARPIWKGAYSCLKSFMKFTGIPSNAPWGVEGPLVITAPPEEEIVVYAMSGGVKKKITLFSSSDKNLSSEKNNILTAVRSAKFQMTGPQSDPPVLSKEQYDWIRAQNLNIGQIVTVKINFRNRNYILDDEKLQTLTMPDVNIGGAPVFKVEMNGKYSYAMPDEMGFLLSRAWDQDKRPIDVGITPRQPSVSSIAPAFDLGKFSETSKKMTGYTKVNGEPVVKVEPGLPSDENKAFEELNHVMERASGNLFYKTRDSGLSGDDLKKQARKTG